MDCSVAQNFSTIKGFSTILTVHLVENVILVIQGLSTILQVSTILQSTIVGFYCTLQIRSLLQVSQDHSTNLTYPMLIYMDSPLCWTALLMRQKFKICRIENIWLCQLFSRQSLMNELSLVVVILGPF